MQIFTKASTCYSGVQCIMVYCDSDRPIKFHFNFKMLLKNFLYLHFLFFLMNYFYFCFILKLNLILNEIKN